MREGDIVQEKLTRWEVILIRKTGWIERTMDKSGDWFGKVWIKQKDGSGHWEEKYYYESELLKENNN